ncbi:hypothetical protein D3C80_1814860 [compost metagenome]
MFFHHVYAFYQYAVFARISSDDTAFFTFVFPADHKHHIIFFHVQFIVMGFQNFFHSRH